MQRGWVCKDGQRGRVPFGDCGSPPLRHQVILRLKWSCPLVLAKVGEAGDE
jgi:hypothetical protein